MSTGLPVRFTEIYGNGNYRGGKIRSFDSMKKMHDEYGIKRIVNLAYDSMEGLHDSNFNCGASSGSSNQGNQMPEGACEPIWAKELGMEFIMAPFWWGARGYQSPCVETKDCPIKDEYWKEIRSALTKGHTYIHCSAGVDRTSAIVSRWTLEADSSATPESVLANAVSYSHGWSSGANQRAYFDDWLLDTKYNPWIKVRRSLYKYRLPLSITTALLLGGTAYLLFTPSPQKKIEG